MKVGGIEAVVSGFEAFRRDSRSRGLVAVERTHGQAIKSEPGSQDEDGEPARDGKCALHTSAEASLPFRTSQGRSTGSEECPRHLWQKQRAAICRDYPLPGHFPRLNLPFMSSPTPQIALVTPVWKDSTRLALFGDSLALALADQKLPVRWIIADDGSGPEEIQRLRALREKFVKIYPHVEVHGAYAHRGKGSVVREAWALAPEADWLAFVDADGSAPPEDMLGLIATAMAEDRSVLGLRKRTSTTQIVETAWRGLAHRAFPLAVKLLLGLPCEDPQCGAKVLKGSDYRKIAPKLVENGLAFDSELLAHLVRSGGRWREVPINWVEKSGGKVRPLRHAWGMLAALWRVRRRIASMR